MIRRYTTYGKDDVIREATALREYLVEHEWGGNPPGGRCNITAPFVCKVFNEIFAEGTWAVIQGDFYGLINQSACWHCWSTNGELIVDLTVDQFNRHGEIEFPTVLVADTPQEFYRNGTIYGSRTEQYYDRWFIHVMEATNSTKDAEIAA